MPSFIMFSGESRIQRKEGFKGEERKSQKTDCVPKLAGVVCAVDSGGVRG